MRTPPLVATPLEGGATDIRKRGWLVGRRRQLARWRRVAVLARWRRVAVLAVVAMVVV